jgi:siroheme synthase-like protein
MAIEEQLYPANLRVAGRPCLVVGGGAVATAKVAELVDCGADVTIVAPEVTAEIESLATAGRVRVDRRPYRGGEVAGYWLAVVATDDPRVNRAVRLDGDGHGVWVNAADDPANCSVTLPARVRQGPILATFSTSGQAPAVATWLRRRYEADLGVEFATVVELVSEARAQLQAEGRSTGEVDWQGALDSGMLDLVREGRVAEARERLQACLSSSSA